MSVAASTAVLALAWFAAVNLAVSAVCWMGGHLVADRVVADSRRSQRLILLRFLPFLTATLASCVLFAPAHLQLEPPDANERYGVITAALACAAAWLLARSAWRALVMLRHTRELEALVGLRTAPGGIVHTELPLPGGIALAGILRPRVLVGVRARQALTPAELEVAIAHERAHHRAGDNATRALMVCVPDFFGLTRVSRRIERLWESEAECLADARAVAGSRDRAHHLASALVKVVRLAGCRTSASPAWSLLHRPALLKLRVHLLLEGMAAAPRPGRPLCARLAVLAVAVVLVAWGADVPAGLHRLTELALARLP